jgi:hypothetical protein
VLINTDEIESVFNLLIKKLHLEGIKSIEIENKDYYWLIGSPEWTDMEKVAEPEVGSLTDDWDSLKKTITGDRIVTYIDFDRLASILRAISEELNPVDGKKGSNHK